MSEMNAIEIKESDVLGVSVSPDEHGDEGMRRINSFIRKREEEERKEYFENIEKSVATVGTVTEPNGEDMHEFEDDVLVDGSEAVTGSITHVHRREHAASVCEPETIAFECKLEFTYLNFIGSKKMSYFI